MEDMEIGGWRMERGMMVWRMCVPGSKVVRVKDIECERAVYMIFY